MNVYFIALNVQFLRMALRFTDFSHVHVLGIIVDGGGTIHVRIGAREVMSFPPDALVEITSRDDGNTLYFLCGYQHNLAEQRRLRDALERLGVARARIVNYGVWITVPHLRRLQTLCAAQDKTPDVVATGISYVAGGLDFRQFSTLCGVSLALPGQDLWHGYQTAKFLFKHCQPRYCLIGLCPYSFRYEISMSFSAQFYAYHYRTYLPEFPAEFPYRDLPLNQDFYSFFQSVAPMTETELAAPIEMGTQRPRMKVYVDFEESLREVVKRFYPDTVRRNVAVLRSYVELCQEKQVQPIFVVFPFARLLRDAYPEEPLAMFRLQLADFVRRYDVPILDFFDETLPDALFSDMSHLNEAGAGVVSRELEQRLIALS